MATAAGFSALSGLQAGKTACRTETITMLRITLSGREHRQEKCRQAVKVVEMLSRIAEVCVNVQASSIRRAFSYQIPPEFSYLDAGWRVVVPFGANAAEGFVLEVRESLPEEDLTGLKSIQDAPDAEAWFDEEMLSTARWISEYYVCSLGEALRLFIPGKSGITSELFYQVAAENSELGDSTEPSSNSSDKKGRSVFSGCGRCLAPVAAPNWRNLSGTD